MRWVIGVASFIVMVLVGGMAAFIYLASELSAGAFLKEFWWMYALILLSAVGFRWGFEAEPKK